MATQDPSAIKLFQKVKVILSTQKKHPLIQKAVHCKIQILNPDGKRYCTIRVPYSPTESVVHLDAELTDKEGKKHAPERRFDEAEKVGEILLSRFRTQVVQLPKLEGASIIEYKYELLSHDPHQLLIHPFQEEIPIRESSFELIHPNEAEVNLQYVGSLPESTSFRTDRDEGRRSTRIQWELRGIPPLRSEPFSPHNGGATPTLYISWASFSGGLGRPRWETSWESIADDFLKGMKRQASPDRHLEETVAHLTKGFDDPIAKMRILFTSVQRSIRSLHLGTRHWSYSQEPVTNVFRRGYGDCKANVALLYTMLRLADVETSFALVNTKETPRLLPKLPSRSWFDHVLLRAYLDEKEIWLDPSSDLLPFGYLSHESEGVPFLLIHENGSAELRQTPRSPSRANASRLRSSFIVRENEEAHGIANLTISGHRARLCRRFLRGDLAEKETLLLHLLGNPQMQIQDLELQGADIPDEALTFDWRFTLPKPEPEPESGHPQIRLPFENPILQTFSKAPVERSSPIDLGFEESYRYEIDLHFPRGATLVTPFPTEQVRATFGTAESSVSTGESRLQLALQLQLDTAWIEIEDAKSFSEFCQAVAERWNRRIVFE